MGCVVVGDNEVDDAGRDEDKDEEDIVEVEEEDEGRGAGNSGPTVAR